MVDTDRSAHVPTLVNDEDVLSMNELQLERKFPADGKFHRVVGRSRGLSPLL